jgi:hypothetical protein
MRQLPIGRFRFVICDSGINVVPGVTRSGNVDTDLAVAFLAEDHAVFLT